MWKLTKCHKFLTYTISIEDYLINQNSNMHSTQLSLTSKITLTALIGMCAVALFLVSPQYRLANEDGTTAATSTRKVKLNRNVDATCMQTAVDAREDAIKSSWESFNTDIVTALGLRKTALHDAWGLSDVKAQKTAIANAWKTWKTSSKNAHSELKGDRKSTWDAFKKTVKETCKVSTPKEESLGADASGSISL
jgi:hypothetical protein